MAFFKDFMARSRDWHEANKRGQRRRVPYGINRGRVYESRPQPTPPPRSRGATASVEATVRLILSKQNGDKIFMNKTMTGGNP